MKINKQFYNLPKNYLFAEIEKRVSAYRGSHPDAKIISLGIGDVTLPLCECVVDALHSAVDDMSKKETFKGYGPYRGYDFLRNSVREYYLSREISVKTEDIFISDGAKSDIGNIVDIFDKDNVVMVPDPVYPVYVDTNLMCGRKIIYLDATEENGFLPMPEPNIHADIIYMCSPNNPTGAVYNKDGLKAWVNYALDNKAIILFDAAYEAFVCDESLPRSIFEIEGARKCAIEFCSLSKTAGFTGTRCGYTIIPSELSFDGNNINELWFRRQSTKFNGVPYIVQRGAQAVFTDDGIKQTRKYIDYYKENAKILGDVLNKLNIPFIGGNNSPYIWLKCPKNMKSWEFFDYLLEKAHIVGTPGSGFGKNGEGFFRLTAFSGRENTEEAARRINDLNW